MSKIIAKQKIGKETWAWVQVSEREARLVRYEDDAKALLKGDKLSEMKTKLKSITNKLKK